MNKLNKYTCQSLFICSLFILFSALIYGQSDYNEDKLFKVRVATPEDAQKLNSTETDILLKVKGGFLVIADDYQLAKINKYDLQYEFIYEKVSRYNLAIDISRSNTNRNSYPIVYEEDGLTILKIDPQLLEITDKITGLAPILTYNLQAYYKYPVNLDFTRALDIDLDSLVGLIVQDSLQSYVEALQAFPPRVTGSTSDYDSRDWIMDKLADFGYDSLVLDTFYWPNLNVQNIVAYKIGNTLPDHQIIIGAHKDAVANSPGADDNGSGTAGVLEIARVLSDIDTRMTFVFVLFTGEEQGLRGSWHYASEASITGDSIVMMLNMDMIGFEGNTDSVILHHGSDPIYAELWKSLADSLTDVNLNGLIAGINAHSDHYPFSQFGYDVIFSIEHVFSSVYHTYQDSTSYLDFSYMARIVKASLATAYVTNYSYTPIPAIAFLYPDGLPEMLTPGVSDTFQIQIEGTSGGTHTAGSGQIHYSLDSTNYTSVYMTDLGAGLYEYTFPAMACEDGRIFYYFTGEEQSTGLYYDRNQINPYASYVATNTAVLFFDDFESDLGWTISGGDWERGIPTGGGGEYGAPDPSSAYSGYNVFGYNLNGDYTGEIPEYHITLPPFDFTELSGIKLSFMRWLGIHQPRYDRASVRLSHNGINWITIWQNESEITDNEWCRQEFDISPWADGQPTVYLRFTMGETNNSQHYCGWNIDDVEVSAYICDQGKLLISTVNIPDWTVNWPFSHQMEAINGVGTLTWSDKYDDLNGTGLSLSSAGIISGTPINEESISFTAMVTDDDTQVSEKIFYFDINPEVIIATETIPDWTVYNQFDFQLETSGGSGTNNWVDQDGGLLGTDLSLTIDGLLTGRPNSVGTISFTARVNEMAGSSYEKTFVFYINPRVNVTTESVLPSAILGEYYEFQMEATGGTGAYRWRDTFGQLFIYGLSISTTGLISGTPLAVDDFYILLRVNDECGDSDYSSHRLIIGHPLICGDANRDGAVNILDATFLIAYLYKGGPAPESEWTSDPDGDGVVNILDITYLINFLYKGGPEPACQ